MAAHWSSSDVLLVMPLSAATWVWLYVKGTDVGTVALLFWSNSRIALPLPPLHMPSKASVMFATGVGVVGAAV